jgi:hypothetical protein
MFIFQYSIWQAQKINWIVCPIMRKKTGHHGFYGQMVSMDHGIKMRVQYLAL